MAALEKAITTQEELDAIIKDRVARAKESAAKEYEGWTSPEDSEKAKRDLEKQIKDLQKAAAEAEKKIADKDKELSEAARYRTDLEKTRIALSAGLDIKYADRLMGESEDEWKKDAEMLAKDFAATHRTAPLGNPEGSPAGKPDKKAAETAAYKSLLAGLDGSKS